MKKSKIQKEVPAFMPNNLDLADLLSKNPPCFKYHIDNFRYIISLITEIPAYNKDVLDKHSHIPINKQKLQKKVREYNLCLKYLTEQGILECDNHYIPKEKARGYRFTNLYSTKVKVELINKNSLVKALTSKSKYVLSMEKKYKFLKKWFDEDLQIDFESAVKYLEDELNKNLSSKDKNAVSKFNASYVALYKIKNHNYFFKVDSNVGRLHTNLTGIKSELRNFITYDGKQMVSIDIVNSQPFLSGLLLNEIFYENQQMGSKIIGLSNLSINKFKSIQKDTSIHSYIMLVKTPTNQSGCDVQKYICHSETGRLYEFISTEIERTTGQKIINRKQLKTMIFTVLFTDNRYIGQMDAAPKRLFKNLFPTVYKIFSMIKQKDSTTLPRLLQTIEAKIILERTVKRLAKELPDVPLFTIHDSIACPIYYKEHVSKVMKEELTDATGLTPTLKFEYWAPEKLDNQILLVA